MGDLSSGDTSSNGNSGQPEQGEHSEDDELTEPPEGWGKYLARNRAQIIKDRKQREDQLEWLEQVRQELKVLQPEKEAPTVRRFLINFTDTVGESVPLRVIFMPDKFCCLYDEKTVSSCTDMLEFVCSVRLNPQVLNPSQISLLCGYLSVASDPVLVDALTPLVRSYIMNGNYFPKWEHVRDMLINLGLTQHAYQFIDSTYYHIPTPKGKPNIRNFRFVLSLIECAFPLWEVSQVEALVKFLSDCLFEVSLMFCHGDVVTLLRRVLMFNLDRGRAVHDLVELLDQSHISDVCNRHIILQFSGDPCLCAITTALTYKTVFHLLAFDIEDITPCLPVVAEILDAFRQHPAVVSMATLYQLLMVVENLVCRTLASAEAKLLSEALLSFAEHCAQTGKGACSIDAYSLLFTRRRLASLPALAGSELGESQKATSDCANMAQNDFSFLRLLLANHFRSHCRYCPRSGYVAAEATVLVGKASILLEDHLEFCSNQIDAFSTYISEQVMLTPKVLKLLLCKFCALNGDRDVEVSWFLELHAFYHPPCRPGMASYYLSVLNERVDIGRLQMLLIDDTFLDLFRRYSLAITTQLPPTTQSLHQLDKMTFLFKYMVGILVEDYFASTQETRVPLFVLIVWGTGNAVSMNTHCHQVVKMMLQAPIAYRRDIGLYLTLLAGAVHRGDEEMLFQQLPTNDMVSAFVTEVAGKGNVSDYRQYIDPIPSPLLQTLIHNELASKFGGAHEAEPTSTQRIKPASQ